MVNKSSILGLVANFSKNIQGASAVEFALLLPVYFSFVIGTIEIGWIAAQEANLYGAVQKISREVYLGTAREKKMTRSQIEALVCANAPTIINCRNRIVVELSVIPNFKASAHAQIKCKTRDDEIVTTKDIKYGGKNAIAFMKTCVTVEPFTPLGARLLNVKSDETGTFRLIYSQAFLVKS